MGSCTIVKIILCHKIKEYYCKNYGGAIYYLHITEAPYIKKINFYIQRVHRLRSVDGVMHYCKNWGQLMGSCTIVKIIVCHKN
jgi:hypothetical protein